MFNAAKEKQRQKEQNHWTRTVELTIEGTTARGEKKRGLPGRDEGRIISGEKKEVIGPSDAGWE
jgi:hypothetical protein